MLITAAIYLAWALWWGLLCLVLCAPRLARAPRLLGLAAVACALHMWALVLPPWYHLVLDLDLALHINRDLPLSWFEHPSHRVDWTSKAAGLLWSLLLVYGLKWVTPAEAGLRRPQPASRRAVSVVVGIVAVILFADAYFSRHAFGALWWHEQLFFSVVPGLEEELFFRGALLGLLSRVFPRMLPLPGTYTSWGGVVGVVLFTLGHGVKFPTDLFVLAFNPKYLTYFFHSGRWLALLHFTLPDLAYHLSMGFLLLWVRERTGSVWAAAGTHCLFNSILTIGHAIS